MTETNPYKIMEIIETDFQTAFNFSAYHDKNRYVWDLFEKFANQMRQLRTKYGAKACMERARWENDSKREWADRPFKVDNNYVAYYARMYNKKYKTKFFNVRSVKGLSRLTPYDGGPNGEKIQNGAEGGHQDGNTGDGSHEDRRYR